MPRSRTSRARRKAPLQTIVFVEPDILIRMVVADYLRECGYIVIEAVSADDALKVFESGRQIDFVLTEVTLPGKPDGFALAKWIRQTHQNVDVILTSGVQRSAEKASDLCDDGPLKKPYEPKDLVRRINLLLERRRTANSKL